MGKLILLFSVFGILLFADVQAQGGGRLRLQQLLMLQQQREMALRRAFPFGLPGTAIPPGLAARIAAASGGGFFSMPFGLSPLVLAQLGAIGPPVVGPGIGLSPLETALLGAPELRPGLTLGEPIPLPGAGLGSSSLAATLGVDASALGPAVATETMTSGATRGGSGFPTGAFRGTSSGPGGPSRFPTGGFRGSPTGPGGPGFPSANFGGSSSGPGAGFSIPTFGGAQRGSGRFAPPPRFRSRFPPRPPRRRSMRGRPGPPVFPRRRVPFREFPQIPQIPQIPAEGFQSQPTTSETRSASNTITNPGRTSISGQTFSSIPSSMGTGSAIFNGRTSEFSTENSPNTIFPSQSAQAPVVVSPRRPEPSRFGSAGSRIDPQQFPDEPMIPQIPEIPSRSTPSRRAPNGMLQFGNQGLNVRFSRLPPSLVGGSFRAGQSGGSFRGLTGSSVPGSGVPRAGFGSQFRGGSGQAGPQAGPAFETASDASQNMNIQFRPLPTNQQGQPGRFNPRTIQNNAFNTGLRADTNMQASNGAGSAQGQTFTIRRGKEASTSGPAEFQIVRVGSLPEFSRTMGSSVDVRMQGNEAVVTGQSVDSTGKKADSVVTMATEESQIAIKPVGDVSKAKNAFTKVSGRTDAIPSSKSSGTDAATDLVIDSSVSVSKSVDTASSSSSVDKTTATVSETETLKLKNPLEPADFSFFAENTNIKPATTVDQPTEVISLTKAAVFEPPAVKTDISKSEPSQPLKDFKYAEALDPKVIETLKQVFLTPEGLAKAFASNTILEFPVQGTAANVEVDKSTKSFSVEVPNTNIQTGSSSAKLSESSSNVIVEPPEPVDMGTKTGLSFFQPPAVENEQSEPNISNIGTKTDISFAQPPPINEVQTDPNTLKTTEGATTQDKGPAV